MTKCLNCQIETSNPKFCTRSCANSYNNKGVIKNKPKPRICKKCKEKFYSSRSHRSRILCSTCVAAKYDYKNMTLAEYHAKPSVLNKHPSWKNVHVRSFNRNWNKDLLSLPCQNCGYNKHVELCHIKSITSFPETTTLGEINSQDNNVQLCRNCHWEFDNGLLSL